MNAPYRLELSPAAHHDLKRLPNETQREIVMTHLPLIQADPYASSLPLTGALRGERSYHFGRKPEYRIIFYLDGQYVIVTIIGTREGVYKRAQRRKT